MRISFISSRIPINGNYLERKGLGGSESALINLSRSFKKLHPEDEITVFANCYEGIYNKVHWKTIEEFYLTCRNFKQDVLISLREPEIFGFPYLDSKLNILWSQDLSNEKSLINLKNDIYSKHNIDIILSVSSFALNDLKSSFPNNKIILLRNGFNEDLVDKTIKKENVAIYTSTPFRGLSILYDVWPQILKTSQENSMDLKLKVFGDMTLYNQSTSEFSKLYKKIKLLENTEVFGAIPQKKLYEELNKAKFMLYPNNYIETSCMSILEALACNVSVITSSLGALPEQVIDEKNGFLCDYKSSNFKEQFVQNSIKAILNYNSFTFPKTTFSWKEQATELKNILERELS